MFYASSLPLLSISRQSSKIGVRQTIRDVLRPILCEAAAVFRKLALRQRVII